MLYGWVGGFLLGTYIFGKPVLAIRRAVSKYNWWMSMEKTDPHNNE
jgi:hypothetical protein